MGCACTVMSISVYVCVSTRLSMRISPEPHTQSLQKFFCMLPMAMARSSSVIHYVLQVLWMTSRFLYNWPYSGMNFTKKDQFCLHFLIYHKSDRIQFPVIKGHNFD